MTQVSELNHQQKQGALDFDGICRVALGRIPDAAEVEKQRVVEDLRLRFHHGGEYVAYVDSYDPAGSTRHLTRRVLAHSIDLAELHSALTHCQPDDWTDIVIDFADPIGNDLEMRPDLPNGSITLALRRDHGGRPRT